MELDDALELLRHPKLGVIDLTGWNVQQLRDKKGKKALEPLLQKVLPRRRSGIERSSYYRALRVELLPDNPYFREDVASLRKLFHIPEGEIADIDLTQFANRQGPWDSEKTLPSGQATVFWLEIHRRVAGGIALGTRPPPLPQWFVDSASTLPAFGEDAPLIWLRKELSIPDRHAPLFDLCVPMDRCVARLIGRYQLPWMCVGKLRFFILTQDSKYLEHIFPFDVAIDYEEATIGGAFKITVDGIDEYTTKEQWDEIFDRFIKHRQATFWEERGELPHSKQIELGLFRQPWAIELYSFVAEHRMAGKRIGVDRALDLMSGAEKLPAGGVDRSVVHRLVKKMDTLFEPKD